MSITNTISKSKQTTITPANPLVFSLEDTNTDPGKTQSISGGISCRSNASYKQKVEVQLKDVNNQEITGTFEGSGENVSMKLQDGKKHLNFSDMEAPVEVSFIFSYKPSGSSSYQLNSSNEVFPTIPYNGPTVEVIDVKTEDSVDHDDNDTYLTLVAHRHNS